MSRSQRLRFVYAITMVLIGVAVCVLGPIIAMAVSRPEFSPTGDLNSSMVSYMNDTHQAGTRVNWVLGVGIAIGGMGALLAFTEWAHWFVSASPKLDR
jgi:hypothetical protein